MQATFYVPWGTRGPWWPPEEGTWKRKEAGSSIGAVQGACLPSESGWNSLVNLWPSHPVGYQVFTEAILLMTCVCIIL